MMNTYFMTFAFIFSAFLSGFLTFFAPCTLPLIPAYLSFISGVSAQELQSGHPSRKIRLKLLYNSLWYIIGFTLVFVAMGTLFGFLGSFFIMYREVLLRIGAIFVLFFGLYLTKVFDLKIFNIFERQKRFSFTQKLIPGKPLSAFLFGVFFAFGWTPCIGPILGSILTLASTSGSVSTGMILLSIFSLGLAIPFFALTLGIGHAFTYIRKLNKYLHIISVVGGIFLIAMGLLLITDTYQYWLQFFSSFFDFLYTDFFLDYL